METMIVNEPIDVGAVFAKNTVKPKWFVWNTKKHAITEVSYLWKDKEGEADILHFSVNDGATMFELSLNQKTLQWRLERTMME